MENTLPVIRKILVVREDTRSEMGRFLEKPFQKCAAAAIIKNPFAGKYVENLSLLYDYGAFLGDLLGKKAAAAFGIQEANIFDELDSYGKGVIVGEGGELEHAHAILHPKLGKPFREALGGADRCPAIMPSTAKMGGVGTMLDIPMHCKLEEWVVSRFDTISILVPDGPRADEIMVAVAVGRNGRPLERVAGMQKSDVK